MRALVALIMVAGCAGVGAGGGGGSTRPGVMPMLSELPSDPAKRNAVLDSSAATAGPEQRQGMTSKERKAETAAATAAAIIGSMFSKTTSVTIGTASQFDENAVLAPLTREDDGADAGDPAKAKAKDKDRAKAPPPGDPTPASDLVPWIKLN